MTVKAFRVSSSDVLEPFEGTNHVDPPPPPPPPPPPTGARQLIGLAVTSGGSSWQGATVTQANEEARLADLFDWPRNGPPVMRLYRQQQNPPYSDFQRTMDDGRIAWISVKPGSGGLAADLTGGSDARWVLWGKYFRDFWPSKIIFSYDHETDRHAYSGASTYSNVAWRNYQTDWVTTFRHIKSVMIGQDPVHSLDNVTFASIQTGWAFQPGSGRDPGVMWHPDIDMVASDPYDIFVYNDGHKEAKGRKPFFGNYGDWSTGAIEYYTWCSDPLQWYEDFTNRAPPAIVSSNLDLFPVRMGLGEWGCQPLMHPNGSDTLWTPEEDVNSLSSSLALQLKKFFEDLRGPYNRIEVAAFWHSSILGIGANDGQPNYFAGPAEHRWGCYWPGVVEVFRQQTSRAEHQGQALTPWGPGGLL